MKKVVAVIKASAISNHFPNRYEVRLNGKSIIDILHSRLGKVKSVDEVVLSTSLRDKDEILVDWAEDAEVPVYRREYTDLAGRLFEAARMAEADVVVKIDGSYPLIVPAEIDALVQEHIARDVSYSYNEHASGVVLGTGCEVASMKAFTSLMKDDSEYTRRVGVSRLRDVLSDDKIHRKDYGPHCGDYRVNMAVESDIAMLEQILDLPDNQDHATIVSFLDRHPWLVQTAKNAIAPVKEVGLEKIILCPCKLSSLMALQKGQSDNTYPVSVELSLTNRCNLKCVWCSDLDLRNRAMKDLEFSVLESLIADLAENGCRGVVIEGGGEPTVYPRFNDVVELIAGAGMDIGLITNGVLSLERETAELFSWIRVSLDCSTPESFQELKGRDCFDDVMANIQRLATYDLVCGVGFVLAKGNHDNLENLVVALRRLGVKYAHFRPVIDHPEFKESLDLGYLQRYSTPEFSVLVDAMDENEVSGNGGCACKSHSLSSVITADGAVYLCGRLNIHADWEPIGNLYEKSFRDLWDGKKRQEQADKLLDPAVCARLCPACRLTKYNVLLDGTSKIRTTSFI